ncbi:MAG: hypothetical protein R2834_01770 [Rhodothermales bacterium]
MPPVASTARLHAAGFSADSAEPYALDRFLADTAEIQRFVADPPEASQHDGDAVLLRAIWTYFAATYGEERASHRYLRFGAVHAALGSHEDAIERAGLGGAGQDLAAPALLIALLQLPLAIDTTTHEAGFKDAAVAGAVQRARLLCSN